MILYSTPMSVVPLPFGHEGHTDFHTHLYPATNLNYRCEKENELHGKKEKNVRLLTLRKQVVNFYVNSCMMRDS